MGTYQTPLFIIGMGSAMGSRRIGNEEVASYLEGWPPEKILERTGIMQRYWCDSERENLYVLMAAAAESAAEYAQVRDIDGLFIGMNATGDFLLPNPGTIVASLLEMDDFYNGQGGTGCCGGLFALEAACNQLAVDAADGKKTVYAAVGADQTSRMMEERSTDHLLFSDAAACLVVTNDRELTERLYTVKHMARTTTTLGGDALLLTTADPGHLHHSGRKTYQFAVGRMPVISGLLPQHYERAVVIPHQANLRILDRLEKQMSGWAWYKESVQAYGNTSPASVMMALEDATDQGFVQEGLPVICASFGEGLSTAVAVLAPEKLRREDRSLLVRRGDVHKEKHMARYRERWSKLTPSRNTP